MIPADSNCNSPYTAATLGIIPGTNLGCVCPDMTTST